MKKILSLLATAVLALTFVSCSSDDDEVAPKQAAFIGNWKAYSSHSTLLKNGEIIEEDTYYYNNDEYYWVWDFRSDNTFIDMTSEDGDFYTLRGNWMTSGGFLYMEYRDLEMGYVETVPYKISHCTSTTFIVQETDTWTEGNVTYEEISEITLKKQN